MKGGLGNQLFQYATGRALSLRQQQKGYTPEKIRLDITGYSAHNGIDTMRIYSLSPFNICADIATPTEIRKLKYPYGNISKAWRLFRAKILRRFYTSFHPKIYDFMGDLYLDGFFQTEKYFNDKTESASCNGKK